MSVRFTEIEYKNFGKCIKAENDAIEMLITVDVGPRILSYSVKGMENMLQEDVNRDTVRDSDELHSFFETNENWYIYGGHRLWTSPESFPESYTPDNSPVKYEICGNKITLTPDDRTKVGERHTMIITFSDTTSDVDVEHIVKNISDKKITLSPWCMTVADNGGVEILPQCNKHTGLLSNRRLVIWEYASVSDERFFMSNDYITLRQTSKPEAFKIGINNEDGWCAYVNKGQIFKKTFDFDETAEYPDFNVNFETYTNQYILEIESLGPLKELSPDEETSFTEHWSITACSDTFDCKNNESIDSFVKKYIL